MYILIFGYIFIKSINEISKIAKEAKKSADKIAKNKDAKAEEKADAKKKSDEAVTAKKSADTLVKKLTGGKQGWGRYSYFL